MDSHQTIHLIHLFILGPALLLIGLGKTDNWIPLPAIAVIGALITLYHVYKFYGRYSVGQPGWVNLIHVLVVGPALMTYGITGDRWAREVILMLAFAAIGYHGYYAFLS
jgi:hypothetical protein